MKQVLRFIALGLFLPLAAQISPYSLSPDWYFGQGGRLTFPTGSFPSSTSPTAAYKGTNTSTPVENSTSVCFSDGSIALYSNTMQGYNGNPANAVWTDFIRNFSTDNRCAGSSTGGAAAFPDPASPSNAFYLIMANDVTAGGCANQGVSQYRFTGTSTNVVYNSGPTAIAPNSFAGEALTIGTDGTGGYWVIIHDKSTTHTFRVWHYTASGITGPTDYSFPTPVSDVTTSQSYLKISPCQDKIAYHSGGILTVHSFNRSTGEIGAEIRRINPGTHGVGLEFSPDGNMLYHSGQATVVSWLNISSGATGTVAGSSSWSMQLGPDGNIYCSPSGTSVGVISNPNSSPSYSTIALPGGGSTFRGLINIAWLTPQVPAINNTTDQCTVDFTHDFKNYFANNINVNPSTFSWDFGDGNNSTSATPSHTYASTGSYDVTLTFQDATCGHTWTATKTVAVNCGASCTNGSTPTNVSVDKSLLCSDDAGNIQLSASGTNVEWFDAGCGNNSIGTGTSLSIPSPTVTTTYYARGNASGGSCSNSSCVSVTVTVNNPTTDPVSISADRTSFCANDDGTIQLTTNGGSGSTLSWFNGNSCSGSTIGTGTSINVSSPTTSVSFSAHYETPGCSTSACVSVTLTPTATPAPSISGTSTACASTALDFSTANNPGNGYNWIFITSGSGQITSATNTNAVTVNNGDADGILIVEESANGCTGKDTVDIVVQTPQVPTADAGLSRNTCVSSTSLSGNNPSPYSGQWNLLSGSATISDINDHSTTISGLTTFAQLEWVITGTCAVSKDTVVITLASSALILSAGDQDDTLCDGSAVDFSVTASGGSGDYTYHWSDTENSFTQTTLNSSITLSPGTGTTVYTVYVSDNIETGCTSEPDSITIFSTNTQELVIPNLVTPNDDNKNDIFELRDVNELKIFPGSSLEVSNRWGQSVYRNQDYDNTWSPKSLSDGLYFYSLKTGCGEKEYKGWLQVLH